MVLMVLLRMISSWITGGGTGSMTTAATGSTAPSTSSPENCSNKPDEPSSPKWNGPAPTHTPTSRLKLANHPTTAETAETTGRGGGPCQGRCRGGGVEAASAVESIAAMASMVLEHAPGTGVGDRGGERFAVQVVCDIAASPKHSASTSTRTCRSVSVPCAYLPRTGAHLSNAELSRVL